MIVESNYAIAIAMLSDWLNNVAPVFLTNEKAKPIAPCIRDFSRALKELLGVLIGSSRCLRLFRLVGGINLVLVVQQSFKNRSKLTGSCLVVERLEEVEDSLCVGQQTDVGERVVLFLKMANGFR